MTFVVSAFRKVGANVNTKAKRKRQKKLVIVYPHFKDPLPVADATDLSQRER
jgi:hypothetical protein